MKNKDVLAMEKAKIVEKMNQAIKDDDAKAFSEAFTELCQKIEDNVLEQAKTALTKRLSLFTELTNAAKKKRTYEKTKPFYKWLALFMVIMGAAALGYGVYSFMNHDTFAVYFVLFGMAAIFLFLSLIHI